MNVHPLLTLLIPTVVAIVSWFAGSWLSVRRDRANKRRDLRVQYLIEAYRRLATATNRKEKETDAEYFAELDSAIVDVQLFGSADQIAFAQQFARELAEHRVAQLDKLLSSLRHDLRKELKLKRIEGPIVVLRSGFDNKTSNNQRSSA
jgi:hypothetical protein